MTKRSLSSYFLIGLTLSTIQGSDMTNTPLTEFSPALSVNPFVEKSRKTWANIIEQKLQAYIERYDRLIEHHRLIRTIERRFLAHLEQAQNPKEGYTILQEDILALDDPKQIPRQMMSLGERISRVMSPNFPPEMIPTHKTPLDEKKQASLDARIEKTNRFLLQCGELKETNIHFLNRLKTAFDKNLEILSQLQGRKEVSKWSLEFPLPTEEAVSETQLPLFANVANDHYSAFFDIVQAASKTSLPLFANVINDHKVFIEIVWADTFEFIHRILELNKERRNRLMALKEEGESLKKTPSVNEIIATFEKDLANTNEYIQKDAQQLRELRTQHCQKIK